MLILLNTLTYAVITFYELSFKHSSLFQTTFQKIKSFLNCLQGNRRWWKKAYNIDTKWWIRLRWRMLLLSKTLTYAVKTFYELSFKHSCLFHTTFQEIKSFLDCHGRCRRWWKKAYNIDTKCRIQLG